MAEILVDVWLYGKLAHFGGQADQGSYANLQISLPEGSTLRELLAVIQLPGEERGLTFINGDLSAMPGMQPDLDHLLHTGDRPAFFDGYNQKRWKGAGECSHLSIVFGLFT